MRVLKQWAFALMCAAIAACGTLGAPAPSSESAVEISAPEYRLGPGDQVRIVVFGQDDLTGQYVISPNGTIAFPLVGDISVATLTVSELTAALSERLQQGFVRNPDISVEVTTFRPFYILGEVGNPGTYPFSANLTVLRAVATAGGFTYRANSHRVFIQHAGEPVEHEYPLTSSTPVHPGDTVRIPERRF